MSSDPVTSRTDPDPAAARDVARRGAERGAVVTLFGRCEVEYDGRAASYLGPGDRLVVLKPDGTLLVHTDEQRTPVNWQPPGSDHDVSVAGDRLVVTSTRTAPEEHIAVRFDAVYQASALTMADDRELELVGSEDDLKERVLADPSVIEAGFTPLATERTTPAGAVDVYGEDAAGNVVVVELKRRRAGPDAVGQLDRYVTALSRDLHADATVRGILVAPSRTDRAAALLEERGLEFASVAPDAASGPPSGG